MVKNVIISMMAAALVCRAECTAYCRGAEFLGVFVISMMILVGIDDWCREQRLRHRRKRRLQRRIAAIVSGEENTKK